MFPLNVAVIFSQESVGSPFPWQSMPLAQTDVCNIVSDSAQSDAGLEIRDSCRTVCVSIIFVFLFLSSFSFDRPKVFENDQNVRIGQTQQLPVLQ